MTEGGRTQELWRLFPEALEIHSGMVEVHPEAAEAHFGALATHPGDV
jgi:hypothetical protein